MPVDILPLILAIPIVICGICLACILLSPKNSFPVRVRVISSVGFAISFGLLFFLYLLPGIRLFPKALSGDAQSQWEVGIWFEAGMNTGLFTLPGLAEKWVRKAAEQNHAHAQYQMGTYRDHDRDYTRAISWYERAATNGIPEGASRAAWLKQR